MLARASLLRACAERLAQLHDLTFAYASVEGVVKDLAKAAGVATALQTDHAAVTAAIGAWREDIASWLSNPATTAPEERQLLTEVDMLCASATAADAFDEIFQAVCSVGEDVYGTSWSAPSLMLDDIPAHPRTPPDDYAIGGQTIPTQPPLVKLFVFSDGLGPATFAALPCLLAHECISHVPAQQDRVKNDSSFAEGFMDWVARYLLRESLGHLFSYLGAAVSAHADAFASVFESPQTREGRARRLGHMAAENLVRLAVTELGMSTVEARVAVARVGRDLNLVQAKLDKKDLVVAMFASYSTLDLLAADVLKGLRAAAHML